MWDGNTESHYWNSCREGNIETEEEEGEKQKKKHEKEEKDKK